MGNIDIGDGPRTRSERLPEFDALRGFAALAVVLFHLFPEQVYWGWVGVDVFFVLSGFLITRIILQGQSGPHFLRNFIARRALRIWPIYYLAIVVALALARLSRTEQPLGGLPYALFFVQNVPAYWGGQTPPFTFRMGHTWTIAVEEQFYLLWPLLVPRVGRFLPRLALVLLIVAFSLRLLLPRLDLLLTRCDGLALGAALAWYSQAARQPTRQSATRAVWIVLCFALVVYATWGTRTYGKPFLDVIPLWRAPTILAASLAAALLITAVLAHGGSPALAPLRLRPLVYVGKISYGVYLFHLLVFWVADGLVVRCGWQRSLLFNLSVVLACVGVAALSWHVIERPILRLRTHFPVSGPALTASGLPIRPEESI